MNIEEMMSDPKRILRDIVNPFFPNTFHRQRQMVKKSIDTMDLALSSDKGKPSIHPGTWYRIYSGDDPKLFISRPSATPHRNQTGLAEECGANLRAEMDK